MQATDYVPAQADGNFTGFDLRAPVPRAVHYLRITANDPNEQASVFNVCALPKVLLSIFQNYRHTHDAIRTHAFATPVTRFGGWGLFGM